MELREAMAALEAAGTAQNRKVYARHGVVGEMFGVSFAALKALAKKIRKDQALAEGLWASGNHDARILATMVADPEAVTARLLDAWAKDLDNYVLTDAFSSVAAASSLAKPKAEAWAGAKGEWTGMAGWNVIARLAMEPNDLPDGWFEGHLARVEREIHTRKNRVRHAMNGALIAIGARNARLEKLALAAAKRIGKVEVDHGETGCKTPDAAAYIPKAAAHRRKKAKA